MAPRTTSNAKRRANSTQLTTDGDEDADGQVVAVFDIVVCKPWLKEHCKHSGCDESQFEEGWLAWHLDNVRMFNRPVPATAKRKFYDLTDAELMSVVHELERQFQ